VSTPITSVGPAVPINQHQVLNTLLILDDHLLFSELSLK
jgi:hypothetical protein